VATGLKAKIMKVRVSLSENANKILKVYAVTQGVSISCVIEEYALQLKSSGIVKFSEGVPVLLNSDGKNNGESDE